MNRAFVDALPVVVYDGTDEVVACFGSSTRDFANEINGSFLDK